MEPNPWMAIADANARELRDLLAEFNHVRVASVCFFASLDKAAWMRSGSASGSRVSVRAVAWIIAGHTQHHHRALSVFGGRISGD